MAEKCRFTVGRRVLYHSVVYGPVPGTVARDPEHLTLLPGRHFIKFDDDFFLYGSHIAEEDLELFDGAEEMARSYLADAWAKSDKHWAEMEAEERAHAAKAGVRS